MEQIPTPARERLLALMRILEHSAEKTLSSAQIEIITGWSSHTIRKDISYLGEGQTIGSVTGYDRETLLPVIKKALGLDRSRKYCITGLGRLGSAYLNMGVLDGFELAAGFDTNVNRIEILPSPAPLYPAYKMAEVISRLGIEIALLCVPAASAQTAAEKLAAAGIRGIVNFAPAVLNLPPAIKVRNVYVTDELRTLAVRMEN
ncbi:MAG: redox-sensing transcriptional repressor Rex [Treponema sp.]|nr:redox-sensing transcriptional repressor Rex [Treponema sp.]